MDNGVNTLVTIRCMAYNQEAFIGKCLEGFVMQITKFHFEAVVHDDASTDKTADVIRAYAEKYPNIIKPYFEKENQWKKNDGSLCQIMNSLTFKSKYIAYCEGDDFWSDPYKLQKQIDILESDESIKLVYTAFSTVDNEGHFIIRNGYKSNMKMSRNGDVLDLLFLKNFIQTCSVCIRTDILKTELFCNCPDTYDYAIFFTAAFHGNVAYLPDVTCSYRKSQKSVTIAQNTEVNRGLWNIYLYFVESFYSGKAKKVSFFKKCKIRSNILTRYLSHKTDLLSLLKRDPVILFFLPYSAYKHLVIKLKNLYFLLIDKY